MKRASLVLLTRDNKVLLGYKKKAEIGTGTLNGPGGKVEEDETIVACAIRETQEEIGVTIRPKDLILVAIVKFFAAGHLDFEVFVYLTKKFSGEPRETRSMKLPEWYDIQNLPFDKMLESDRHWIPIVLAGKKFRANVYYKGRARDFEKIEFLPFI
ncbi:MAG TPA: 8-oxo-dGTP diphosphatase [Candidatus Paceibacterota bacterium]|nr:8-oxo-dGTP diphosphatase [Candidatus Paceibacterota bacterium]